MLPEGMVHALELLHGLIAPRGRLVDIHPTGEPPVVLARLTGGEEIQLGNLQEIDDFIEYRQAEAALAHAVAQGWFAVEHDFIFPFRGHAASIDQLSAYLKEEWLDAVLPGEVFDRIRALDQAGKHVEEIISDERIRIMRLKPEKI